MSQENVKAVRESYETPGLLFSSWHERMAPDVEFDFTGAFLDRPVLRGIEELSRFNDQNPWDQPSFEAERFVDLDDERVLVLVTARATARGSGIPLEFRAAHEWTIRDGVLVRWKTYANPDEALKAVGLEE